MTNPKDPQNMEQVLLDSPKQFIDGIKAASNNSWNPPYPIEKIQWCGMGGSWMAGALLKETNLLTVPLEIHRSYGLPNSVTDKTLVVASSFSGNTEETLSAYDEAKKRGLALIGVASGGSLEEKCKNDGVPFLKIPVNPPTMQPRCGTGYFVGIFAQLLSRLGLAVPDAVNQIESLVAHLERTKDEARKQGEELALQLVSSTPIIYSSIDYRYVARIWKIKINENSKTAAFWNYFPELNHNEMVGWTQPHGAFHVIILRDEKDHPSNLKRMEITSSVLQEKGIRVSMVAIEGGTKLERVFSTLLIGDWLSYRLALELQVDPSPVAMVEDFKKRLK